MGYGSTPISANKNVGAFIHFDIESGLSNSYAIPRIEDHEGNIWLATGRGAVKFKFNVDPNRLLDQEFMWPDTVGNLTYFTFAEGLRNNRINDIIEGQDGNLWFASWGGGAIFFDQKANTFTHFTTKEGLDAQYRKVVT